MKQEKTLYISDLDGTLLSPSAELSPYAKASLNKMAEEGLFFSVATARTAASSLKILSGLRTACPVAFMNGVLLYDREKEECVRVNRLPKESASAVLAVLKQAGVTGLLYEWKEDGLLTYFESGCPAPIRDFIALRQARYYKTFQETTDLSRVLSPRSLYFTLLDTYERMKPVYDAVASLPGVERTLHKDNYSQDLWYLEIFSAAASKEKAVRFLRETCGFTRVVGFGDAANDLPLFSACDVAVAVENAAPEVRSAAHFICPSNKEDGVVKWILEDFSGNAPDRRL